MNENETPETVTETPSTTPSRLTQKALILGGTVAGIIIAGGFAFLKKNQTSETMEVYEAIDVTIESEPDTDADQN